MRARLEKLGWTLEEIGRLTRLSKRQISSCLDGRPTGSEEAVSTLERVLALDQPNHPIDDPELSTDQRRALAKMLYRRALAQELAEEHPQLDAGSIERVLGNLELPPGERLARGLQRGRLKKHARR